MESKNVDGSKGKICNECGGYGFTYGIRSFIGCIPCKQTGVQPENLEQEVKRLKELLCMYDVNTR